MLKFTEHRTGDPVFLDSIIKPIKILPFEDYTGIFFKEKSLFGYDTDHVVCVKENSEQVYHAFFEE